MGRRKNYLKESKNVAAFDYDTCVTIKSQKPKHLGNGRQTRYDTYRVPDHDPVMNDPSTNLTALRDKNISGSRTKSARRKQRIIWGIIAMLLLAVFLVGGRKTYSACKAPVDVPPDDGVILYAIGKEFEKKKDYIRAVEWYEKATESGNTNAMKNLGHMYFDAIGVKGDTAKSVEWYKKAADAGDSGAIYAMGWLCRYGSINNPEKALEWFLKSAAAGYAGAMTEIGDLYKDGSGVTQDYTEAMRWYRKASKAGDSGAMAKIGMMYMTGLGEEKNIDKAIEWYTKSAEAGNSVAMYNLGFWYETGEGVPQDSGVLS